MFRGYSFVGQGGYTVSICLLSGYIYIKSSRVLFAKEKLVLSINHPGRGHFFFGWPMSLFVSAPPRCWAISYDPSRSKRIQNRLMNVKDSEVSQPTPNIKER